MTLQPGTTIQQVHQHKWPLRPGVQVHVNGTNSLTLAASGSVLLSPADQAQTDASSSGRSRSRSGSTDSQSSHSETKKNSRGVDRQTVETGNPYYETLRDQKRSGGGDSGSGSQATDSGSESTRSVIRVKGPSRPKNVNPVATSNQTSTSHQTATGSDMASSGRLLTAPHTPTCHRLVLFWQKRNWHDLLFVIPFQLGSDLFPQPGIVLYVVWYLLWPSRTSLWPFALVRTCCIDCCITHHISLQRKRDLH